MMDINNKMVSDQYKKILKCTFEAPVNDNVIEKTMLRIENYRLMQMRFRAMFYGVFVIGSLIVFKPVLDFFIAGAVQSGFAEYISVLVSGGFSFAQTWTDLALSLIESAPVVELGAVALVVFLFAFSVKHIVNVLSNLSSYEHKHAHIMLRHH